MEILHRNIGDVTAGILLIYIIRITTEHLDDTYVEFCEVDDLVRDELRRPIPVTQLAARAGVPAETARRQTLSLIEKNWVAQTDQGRVYLTREMLRAPPWPAGRRDNVANLGRLVESLDNQGALASWGL